MPTYEYECGNCESRFEYFQQISEAPKKKCPNCGKLRLKRLIGAGSGFLFKGSGFYTTDYRSSEYQSKAKAEGAKGSADASSGSASGSDAAKGADGKSASKGSERSSTSSPSDGAKSSGKKRTDNA